MTYFNSFHIREHDFAPKLIDIDNRSLFIVEHYILTINIAYINVVSSPEVTIMANN